MRTVRRAHAIVAAAPHEAVRDAIGVAVMAALIFAGFMLPAFV